MLIDRRSLLRRAELARPHRVLVTFIATFVFFLIVRWPFAADFLVNWDSVQFALAVTDYRIEAHQPHPPGYIGYVALARVLSWLVGDIPTVLTLISVVTSALAPAAFFLLAHRLLAFRYAVAATLLFGFSPLLWYYGNVALTYAPEVALVLFFVWSAHRAVTEGRLRDLILATLFLAFLGAVRQSAMVLTAGVWVVAIWAFPWRARMLATLVLGVSVAMWAVPLLWLAGGPGAYLRESAALAEIVGTKTSVFTSPVAGVSRNLLIMGAGLVAGLHFTPVIIGIAHLRHGNVLMRLRRPERWLLGMWAVPSLVFFLLGHAGQIGYVLLILPVAFIWLGLALSVMERPRRAAARKTASLAARRFSPAAAGVSALLAVSLLVQFMLPRTMYALATSEIAQELTGSPADPHAAKYFQEHPVQSPLAMAVRQYSIADNDRYWRDVVQYLEGFEPDEVIILTSVGGPLMSGSFRHLGYYLPEHRIYGIGSDLQGEFGLLFVASGRESSYGIRGMETSSDRLWLPASVRWIAIPDGDLVARLDPSLHVFNVETDSGATISLLHVEAFHALRFAATDDGQGIGTEEGVTDLRTVTR